MKSNSKKEAHSNLQHFLDNNSRNLFSQAAEKEKQLKEEAERQRIQAEKDAERERRAHEEKMAEEKRKVVELVFHTMHWNHSHHNLH